MAVTVDVMLEKKGIDAGNFSVVPLDNSGNEITASGWPKTNQAFTIGVYVRYTDVPDTAYQIKIKSNSACTNDLIMRFKN